MKSVRSLCRVKVLLNFNYRLSTLRNYSFNDKLMGFFIVFPRGLKTHPTLSITYAVFLIRLWPSSKNAKGAPKHLISCIIDTYEINDQNSEKYRLNISPS